MDTIFSQQVKRIHFIFMENQNIYIMIFTQITTMEIKVTIVDMIIKQGEKCKHSLLRVQIRGT